MSVAGDSQQSVGADTLSVLYAMQTFINCKLSELQLLGMKLQNRI